MYTLAHALRRADGERRGRATLRLAMVVAFLVAQSVDFAAPGLVSAVRLWPLSALCLCGLGASLGMTAAGDRDRMTAFRLASDRVRRAYPIYVVTILTTVFVLGPLLSNGGAAAYIRDGETFAYLLNLVGVPVYELPGVFEFNDIPRIVNAMVWLAPVYAVALVVACLPIRPRLATAAPALLLGSALLGALLVQGLAVAFADGGLAALLARGDALSALLGGLFGIVFYRAQRRVPLNNWLATIAAAMLVALALVGHANWLDTAAFRVVTAAPTAYLVVFLTVRRLAWPGLSRRFEPYLAGTILLAFPVQQVMTDRGPQGPGLALHLGAIAAAMAASALFWHALGRRLLPPVEKAAAGPAAIETEAMPLDLRWIRRLRRGVLVQNLAITLVMSGMFIGVMVLLYIALQPESAM